MVEVSTFHFILKQILDRIALHRPAGKRHPLPCDSRVQLGPNWHHTSLTVQPLHCSDDWLSMLGCEMLSQAW